MSMTGQLIYNQTKQVSLVMNKTALKNFATSARNELIKKVEARALKIGITEESVKKAQLESSDAIYIDGKQLSVTEKKQRDRLIQRIREIGYRNVVEEVAYTWFNRFIALRFMEVNNYLPTKVRVLSSSEPGNPEPDIIKEALTVDLDIDEKLVYDLKLNNQTEELFKYMVIKQCNDLNKFLPFMFETIEDYKEILFPDNLLSSESFVRQLTNVDVIPEEDWDQIEIIGWLYQYYNSELNELVYDGSMSKSRVPKELLPAATQLFTPDWAVQYMVENSLGRLWLEGQPDNDLKDGWEYYLDKTGGQSNRTAKSQHVNPETIKVFDPCMGSGHILVYAFDILMQIYQSCGYVPRDAAKLILEKNLYGLEIDDRAYQLACFALVMKARKYNRRVLNEAIELNLCSIVESNELKMFGIKFESLHLYDKDVATADYLISVFLDAKEYGSILDVEERDYASLDSSVLQVTSRGVQDLFELELINKVGEILPKLTKQARIMSQKYDIVITNPPYLGNARMSPVLNDFARQYYPNTKTDLSMIMYQKTLDCYSKKDGFVAFITTTSWMFLKSFETFRKYMLSTVQLETLVDFGTELFDGKVGHNPIVSWVIRNSLPHADVVAIRLVDYRYSKREQKKSEYFNLDNRYISNQREFDKIPGSPIAYWATEGIVNAFLNGKPLSDYGDARRGLQTGDAPRFVRAWFEVASTKVFVEDAPYDFAVSKSHKWFLFNSGGSFRKWFGNIIDVVDWEHNGANIKSTGKAIIPSEDKYFKPCISWNKVSSGDISVRYQRQGIIQGDASPFFYTPYEDILKFIMALLNSTVAQELMKILSPTLNFEVGNMAKLPVIMDSEAQSRVIELVDKSILISILDWDSFETSWGFRKHPLLIHRQETISSSFDKWSKSAKALIERLKTCEEELNQLFVDLYGLEKELTSVADQSKISVRPADLQREIKSLIAYAVGCMFGRYSLDEDGLVFAGGNFNPERYRTFTADVDNILPVLSDAYFEDDIVSKFVEFVKVTFGEESLTENLEFIADTLGKKDSETAKEAIRRYFLNDFFKDHLQTYKKKPIYWLFTSGKQKAFNCLIYMHRYDKTTLSRIRTDYVHELQMRYDAEKKSLLSVIEGGGSARESSAAKKELKTLELKIAELKEYEEVLHHMADQQIEIDLDNGVDVNYGKFEHLLAKRK